MAMVRMPADGPKVMPVCVKRAVFVIMPKPDPSGVVLPFGQRDLASFVGAVVKKNPDRGVGRRSGSMLGPVWGETRPVPL